MRQKKLLTLPLPGVLKMRQKHFFKLIQLTTIRPREQVFINALKYIKTFCLNIMFENIG